MIGCSAKFNMSIILFSCVDFTALCGFSLDSKCYQEFGCSPALICMYCTSCVYEIIADSVPASVLKPSCHLSNVYSPRIYAAIAVLMTLRSFDSRELGRYESGFRGTPFLEIDGNSGVLQSFNMWFAAERFGQNLQIISPHETRFT